MKLYEVIRVYEARKNPEQNPKLSPVEQLRKYKDDPDIFISFKTVPMVHINPEYPFNTPVGVYFYPLQAFWQRHADDFEAGKFPAKYATHMRYIHVIKYNGKGKKAIRTPNDYSQSDLDHDIKMLGKLGYDVNGIMDKLPNNKYTGTPFGQLWNSINVLTDHITGEASTGANKMAIAKNKIFRQLGYAYICEPTGTGVIHPNEPSQGFFLSGAYVKQIDRIDTKLYLLSKHETKFSAANAHALQTAIQEDIDVFNDDWQELRDDIESHYGESIDFEKISVSVDGAGTTTLTIYQDKPIKELLGYLKSRPTGDYAELLNPDETVIGRLADLNNLNFNFGYSVAGRLLTNSKYVTDFKAQTRAAVSGR